MTRSIEVLLRVLLLSSLLHTGVTGQKDSVFVYGRLGGQALLPCSKQLPSDCSSVTWTFFKGGLVRYTEEVSGGRVRMDSDKSSRISITSNCSIILHSLTVEDAGSYVCLENQQEVTDIYLSLLSIDSSSPITDLRAGGTLTLSCVLFTYYDAGSCKSYSSVFRLQWMDENGEQLPQNTRYQLIENTRCNVTLLIKLQAKDNNRRWRCQVNTTQNSRAALVDFRSSFLFQSPSTEQSLEPLATARCPVELPVSRILLCVALPLMVSIVGIFTWKTDHKKAKMSAAVVELQEVH
ncbi:uncharacterized protein [Nothobranchius furzeri]|uniref:LOC107379840-like protein n=1 Tax=Nothobranchius furzeri TaxID=105023 RepID=A0A9D2YCZ5_NOTFU|nr:uncharacterized protein LOC107379840 [Nothobranchius furzeri]KAF7218322.1 putative LOC107379840-like protein [Nothobranchius furzeri]